MLLWLRKSYTESNVRLQQWKRGEKKERGPSDQKVAGLRQSRGGALVPMTKTDGANPVSLLGRREGQAMPSYLGGPGWDAGGNSLSGNKHGIHGEQRGGVSRERGERGQQWDPPEEEGAT